MKVLFLCKGNTGRSAFAEGLYKKLVTSDDVSSAGTQLSGAPQTLGSRLPSTQYVIDTMKTEGIDVSDYSRKLITEEMVKDADLIVDMSEQDVVPDFVKKHSNRVIWKLEDPKGTNYETHVKVKNQIKEKIIETFLKTNML